MNKWLKIFLIIGGLSVIFFLAFQYAFLTDFPIGHDAGHHVSNAILVEKSGLFNLNNYKSMLYPIPWIVFTIFHKFSGIAWPQLFLYTICFFLFLAATSWSYFATRATAKWEIGITAGIFLASSRWLSDALRIGFLGEAWGWFVFILCSYFLVKRKFWPFVLLLVLLFFSHPLVLMVFVLVLIIYSVVIVISKPKKEDRLFIIKILSVLLLAGASILIFSPEKIQTFLQISQSAYIEGARSLKNIIIDSDKRRILIYLIGLAGIIKSIQFWRKNEIKFLLVLLFVSIILTQLYLWGINFWVFRFYPYFEMAISAFAAIGLYYLIETLPKIFNKNFWIRTAILVLSIYFLILPNWQVNRNITIWQSHNYQLLFTCPPADREAFEWVKNNLTNDSLFLSPTKWGAWLRPLGNVQVVEWDSIYNPNIIKEQVLQFISNNKIQYIYFSSVQIENQDIEKNNQDFELVYTHENVRIYKVR